MSVPDDVLAAARARAEARAAKDWPTADRLRGEIEAAGWRVVDRGTDFRLEPGHPPDVEAGGEIRYGRSDSVPSRLDEAPTGVATFVLAIGRREAGDGGLADVERSLGGALRQAAGGVDAVIVADGLEGEVDEGLGRVVERIRGDGALVELVRTSAVLGRAAALNAGIRRAAGRVVVALDASVEPARDVVTPLVEALTDPTVAIAGPFGLRSADLRRFEEVVTDDEPLDAAAIQGYLMAFRRSDAAARGPLDEAFRYYRNLDVWWSLVLRDEGEGRPPRRALVVPGPAIRRAEPRAWTETREAERERLSKRNFYRVLDRFRARLDLAVPGPG